MFAIGGPLAYILVWQYSENTTTAILATLIYTVFLLIAGLVNRIINELQESWAKSLADFLDKRVRMVVTKNETKYYDFLYTKFRWLDMRGLRTADLPYYLLLDRVFVELDFGYYNSEQSDLRIDLVETLCKMNKDEAGKFVILGSPGSGKTTLLKYLTLQMANNRRRLFKQKNIPNKVPILMPFRQFAKTIVDTPKKNLADILSQQYLEEYGISLPKLWLVNKLQKGQCIIMLDGLDEVADSTSRRTIVDWTQTQIELFPKNYFLITSRPFGYLSNKMLGVEMLEIQELNSHQINAFAYKWYLANEAKKSGTSDEGVKREAREGATKLIRALQRRKELNILAENPLLLTMIATVYSIKEDLPARRVELYQQIVEVSLERRAGVDNEDTLTTSKKAGILEVLAYYMINKGLTDISRSELESVIQERLAAADPYFQISKFIEAVRDQSGLLVEPEEGVFKFAHKTFQEYLASSYIVHNKGKLERKLIAKVGNEWWAETTRLYVAQAEDATKIIKKCFEAEIPSTNALALAIDILVEASGIAPKVRFDVIDRIDRLASAGDPEKRKLVAEARLSSRIHFMSRVASGIWIDDNLITNMEYQLFLDAMMEKGKIYTPDYWTGVRFRHGNANEPVLGIRHSDAVEFCKWLTEWDARPNVYRLPTHEEAAMREVSAEQQRLTYWSTAPSPQEDSLIILEDKTKLSVVLERSYVQKILSEDIKNINNLNSAMSKRTQKRKTTEELLANIIFIPGRGTYSWDKKQVASIESILDVEYQQDFYNRLLLEADDIYSMIFGLDLEFPLKHYVEFFFDKKNNNFMSWLSTSNTNSFSVSAFLIDNTAINFEQFVSDTGFGNATESSLYKIAGLVSSALYRLRTREWAAYAFSSEKDQSNAYAFLRWYIRVGLLYMIGATTERLKNNIDYLRVQEKILDNSKRLLLDMINLEKQIHEKISSSVGIRIIKEQRLINRKNNKQSNL